MAYGRPVVATAVGGLVDAIEDGVTGVLVAPGSISALRDAVVGLLEDGARRSELGAAARVVTNLRYSAESAGAALAAAYGINGRGPGRAPGG